MAMDTVNVSYTDAIEIGTLGRCTCWFIQIITDVTPLIYANGKSLTLLGVSSPSVSMGTWFSNDELMIMASGRETTLFSDWRAHCWCRLAPALTLSIPMRLSSVSWTMIGGVLFVWTELLCCTEHLKPECLPSSTATSFNLLDMSHKMYWKHLKWDTNGSKRGRRKLILC